MLVSNVKTCGSCSEYCSGFPWLYQQSCDLLRISPRSWRLHFGLHLVWDAIDQPLFFFQSWGRERTPMCNFTQEQPHIEPITLICSGLKKPNLPVALGLVSLSYKKQKQVGHTLISNYIKIFRSKSKIFKCYVTILPEYSVWFRTERKNSRP